MTDAEKAAAAKAEADRAAAAKAVTDKADADRAIAAKAEADKADATAATANREKALEEQNVELRRKVSELETRFAGKTSAAPVDENKIRIAGVPGGRFHIVGVGLGEETVEGGVSPKGGVVLFGSAQVPLRDWHDTEISGLLPDTVQSCTVTVHCANGKKRTGQFIR